MSKGSIQADSASCADGFAPRKDCGVRRGKRATSTIVALILAALFISTQPSLAQPSDRNLDAVAAQARHVVVTLNKSRTVQIGRVFASAVVGASDIADVLPMS